jgi:hypothetical protein
LCRELVSSMITAKFSVVYDCVLTCAVVAGNLTTEGKRLPEPDYGL